MPKSAAEPEQPAFVPIEHTPIQDNPDVAYSFTPIEHTPFQDLPAAPVAEHTEPATGDKKEN